MKIMIGGDFAATEYNYDLFRKADISSLYSDEMVEYMKNFDLRVFDFETVIGGEGKKIKKDGPHMIMPIDCMPGVTGINPDLMILANNHTFNLGANGLRNTMRILDDAGINHIGAGCDINEASKAFIVEDKGAKIGFYACAEHEFNAAGHKQAGVNPYDPLTVFDEIRSLKKNCDQLIVFYHGGLIEFRYPLPYERRVLRKMVDCGADLVIGQHTHCIGCQEEYHGKRIIYGQGDFLFARPTNNDCRYSGLIVDVDFSENELKVSYRVRIKPDCTIRFASEKEEKEILRDYENRSREILDSEKYEQIYGEFLKERVYSSAFRKLFGKRGDGLFYFGMNKITKGKYIRHLVSMRYKEKDLLGIENLLDCESLRESFTDVIRQICRGDVD